MSQINKGITIGNSSDPVRLAQRLARVREAMSRAEGERLASLTEEAGRLEARLSEIRAACDAALGAAPAA